MSRRLIFVSALLLALAVLAQPIIAGTVTGKVIYDDKVPKLRPLKMDADPVCAEKNDGPVYPDLLVLGEGGEMSWVLVQVTGVPAKQHKVPSEAVVIDQRGCRYLPHVVGAMVGQEVMFRNSDGILHNVHGMPKVNREFNIGMPATLKEKTTTFTKPEEVFPVKCDVHPWMKAWVAVMEHPYFDVTGEDGTYSIDGLPAGDYEVVAWHEKLGSQKSTVTVGADGSQAVDFAFKIPKRK